MSRYTLVFEWPDGEEPKINRGTSLSGGSICAVQFSDVLAEREAVCTWTEDANGIWHTDCGEAFEIHAGSPGQNGLRFCCFCGRKLAEGST